MMRTMTWLDKKEAIEVTHNKENGVVFELFENTTQMNDIIV